MLPLLLLPAALAHAPPPPVHWAWLPDPPQGSYSLAFLGEDLFLARADSALFRLDPTGWNQVAAPLEGDRTVAAPSPQVQPAGTRGTARPPRSDLRRATARLAAMATS